MYPCINMYRTCIPKRCQDITGESHLYLKPLHDEEVDLCGVIFVRITPRSMLRSTYVSRRVGYTVEMMDVDGAFVTTEGFGNNHIDSRKPHRADRYERNSVVGLHSALFRVHLLLVTSTCSTWLTITNQSLVSRMR